jgi:hypothetical protein
VQILRLVGSLAELLARPEFAFALIILMGALLLIGLCALATRRARVARGLRRATRALDAYRNGRALQAGFEAYDRARRADPDLAPIWTAFTLTALARDARRNLIAIADPTEALCARLTSWLDRGPAAFELGAVLLFLGSLGTLAQLLLSVPLPACLVPVGAGALTAAAALLAERAGERALLRDASSLGAALAARVTRLAPATLARRPAPADSATAPGALAEEIADRIERALAPRLLELGRALDRIEKGALAMLESTAVVAQVERETLHPFERIEEAAAGFARVHSRFESLLLPLRDLVEELGSAAEYTLPLLAAEPLEVEVETQAEPTGRLTAGAPAPAGVSRAGAEARAAARLLRDAIKALPEGSVHGEYEGLRADLLARVDAVERAVEEGCALRERQRLARALRRALGAVIGDQGVDARAYRAEREELLGAIDAFTAPTLG